MALEVPPDPAKWSNEGQSSGRVGRSRGQTTAGEAASDRLDASHPRRRARSQGCGCGGDGLGILRVDHSPSRPCRGPICSGFAAPRARMATMQLGGRRAPGGGKMRRLPLECACQRDGMGRLASRRRAWSPNQSSAAIDVARDAVGDDSLVDARVTQPVYVVGRIAWCTNGARGERSRASGEANCLVSEPKADGSPAWTRTRNPLINSQMLCQLSYRGPRWARVGTLPELQRTSYSARRRSSSSATSGSRRTSSD